jgi:hypothetical protein
MAKKTTKPPKKPRKRGQLDDKDTDEVTGGSTVVEYPTGPYGVGKGLVVPS